MRSLGLGPLVVSAVFTGAACLAASGHHNVSTRTDRDDVRSCSDLRVEFDDEPAVTAEETLSVPAGSGNVLTVRSPQNGGVYVAGGNRRDFGVTTCKAVAPAKTAREQLDAMHTTVTGGTISTSGAADDDTVVFYLVEAPAGGAIDLSTHNGPISVRDFTGRSTVHTLNGPVNLKRVAGEVKATAQNGPIHFEGTGGTVELETQNGPIGVRLAGSRWTEGSLTARAQNGPAQLECRRDSGPASASNPRTIRRGRARATTAAARERIGTTAHDRSSSETAQSWSMFRQSTARCRCAQEIDGVAINLRRLCADPSFSSLRCWEPLCSRQRRSPHSARNRRATPS